MVQGVVYSLGSPRGAVLIEGTRCPWEVLIAIHGPLSYVVMLHSAERSSSAVFGTSHALRVYANVPKVIATDMHLGNTEKSETSGVGTIG